MGLHLTSGAINSTPRSIQEAAGRRMAPDEARDCFGCRTAGAHIGQSLQLEKFELGLQCAGRHGPVAAHIAAIRAARVKRRGMRTLSTMNAEAVNEFCVRRHRTREQVMLPGVRGPNTVKSAPYRLTNSKCDNADGRRVSCVARRNPHEPLTDDPAAYDVKWRVCHAAESARETKRLETRPGCVTCHMPRVEGPGSRHAFSDHWIRLARPGDPYPEERTPFHAQ
jgi:hypothetical protein